jgi:hypothetical protein
MRSGMCIKVDDTSKTSPAKSRLDRRLPPKLAAPQDGGQVGDLPHLVFIVGSTHP